MKNKCYVNEAVLYRNMQPMLESFVYLFLRYELFINLLTWLFCLPFSVPASVQPISNVSVVEGANVSLYCNASGVPDPTVTWSGNVNKVIMGRWLNITNISRPADKRNNHLIYRCHANNTCGDALRVASVEVLCKDMFVLFLNNCVLILV